MCLFKKKEIIPKTCFLIFPELDVREPTVTTVENIEQVVT